MRVPHNILNDIVVKFLVKALRLKNIVSLPT